MFYYYIGKPMKYKSTKATKIAERKEPLFFQYEWINAGISIKSQIRSCLSLGLYVNFSVGKTWGELGYWDS